MGDSDNKLSDELARNRTELAKLRNDLAESRTLQAAERTYAAWIRTGFTIAGAGWTLVSVLQGSDNRLAILFVGGALIVLGLLCFVYAWIGFKSVYDFLKENSRSAHRNYPFKMNLITVTILSTLLFIIFVVGYGLLLF
ncbi:MAG: DUF202 domain-containing protein [Alkalibacterium sp.]|uniref:YidH family protein n=1 Tax=Alkalibacterium sp. TaxID=1872447 RepID=UPI0039711441